MEFRRERTPRVRSGHSNLTSVSEWRTGGGAPGGTPELYFTDPDGLLIQLQDVSYCGGGGFLGNACEG